MLWIEFVNGCPWGRPRLGLSNVDDDNIRRLMIDCGRLSVVFPWIAFVGYPDDWPASKS